MKISNDLRIFLLSVLNFIAVCGLVLSYLWDSTNLPLYVYCLHCYDCIPVF